MNSKLFNGHHNIVSERVKIARGRKGISQKNLAEKLQTEGIVIDNNGISRIECDNREVQDYEIKYLAKYLDVSVNWLLGEGDL